MTAHRLPPPRFNMARYCIGRAATADPDKVALTVVSDVDAPLSAAERWTFGELDETVRRIAAGLLAEGLAPGDRLLVRLPNGSDYALVFFGAIAAGIVPVRDVASAHGEEAAFLIENSGAAADGGDRRVIVAGSHRTIDGDGAGADQGGRSPPRLRRHRRRRSGIHDLHVGHEPDSRRACCTPSAAPGGGGRSTPTGTGSPATTSCSTPARSTGASRSAPG